LKKLLEDNASDLIQDQLGIGQASTLLLKRLAFTHEKEVRIVYHNNNCNPNDKIYPYKLNPNICFEEIVVDPRIPKDIYNEIKKQIEATGFKNKIIQSGLYKLEKLSFNAKFQ